MKTDLQAKLDTFKRGYIQVDLDAIENNVRKMKAHIAEGTRILAVIKADGYGHGCESIARSLEDKEAVFGFAVATPEEAMRLRKEGITKPILILGYTFPYCYEMLAREEIRTAIFRYDTIKELGEVAERVGKKIKVHIKVDTGMSRIGITPDEEGLRFVHALMEEDGIEIEGIFTHFAKADESDKSHVRKQLKTFCEFVEKIEKSLGFRIPIKHCSNSAGILELPEANLDMVRAGIALYGLAPSEEVTGEALGLCPALSFYSHIVYIKTIRKGQSVSYGGTFTAETDMRVATIPIGYGDGYPRSLSGKGYVLVNGKKAPILGRVCMDQFMVDVTDIPEAAENNRVTLIGCDGEMKISAEDMGDMSGRFNYELVCDLGKRIPRVYLKNGEVIEVKEEL